MFCIVMELTCILSLKRYCLATVIPMQYLSIYKHVHNLTPKNKITEIKAIYASIITG